MVGLARVVIPHKQEFAAYESAAFDWGLLLGMSGAGEFFGLSRRAGLTRAVNIDLHDLVAGADIHFDMDFAIVHVSACDNGLALGGGFGGRDR